MLKLIAKVIAGIILLLVIVIAGAIISMGAHVPDALYQPSPSAMVRTADNDSSYLVIGGRKGAGLEVIKVLRARGERVTAVIRPSSLTPEKTDHLKDLGVELVAGDATNPDDMALVFNNGNYLAVVSTIGCFSCEPPTDYLGNKIITDATKLAGVKRIIQVSSIGAGDSFNTAPWISRNALAKVLPLKTQAEEYLVASELDYTIIRPGGLKSGTASGYGYLSENREAFGFIDRTDLARLIVGALDDDESIGKTYHAADESRTWIFQ